MIKTKYVFYTEILVENPKNLQKEALEFFTEPPPGIDPIEVEIAKAHMMNDDIAAVHYKTTVEEYLRNMVQYGATDPYELLNEIKPVIGAAAVKYVMSWLKSEELTIAKLEYDPIEGLQASQETAVLNW